MGGYGSGRTAYGNDKRRLSGLPGEGESSPWGYSPMLRFSTRELKRVSALVPGATRFFSFSGEAIAEIPAPQQKVWPAKMRRNVEEVRDLFNAPEHRDVHGLPALWVRSHCFGALFDKSGSLKDEPDEEEQDESRFLYGNEKDEREREIANLSYYLPHEMRFWLPRLLPRDGVKESARSSSYLLSGEPRPVSFSVSIQSVPCHKGGFKFFFLCPLCQKRASFLYLERRQLRLYWNGEGHLAWMLGGDSPCCRVCGGWTYESQNEGQKDRTFRRITKAQLQLLELGAPPIEHIAQRVPKRPKGMHFDTHERFARTIRQADAQLTDLCLSQIARIEKRVQFGKRK